MSVPDLGGKEGELVPRQEIAAEPEAQSARKSSRAPETQVSSRGRRKALRKSVLNMWTKAAAIIRLADQLCTERISQPNCTSVMMNCTLSNAASALGR